MLEEAEPVGGVFLERAAWAGESSHALRGRCFSEHHVSGRCQRQMSSLFLPEHVWVCLLLEKGYKRAAAISGCSLSGHIVQIRLSGVKKGKFAEMKGVFFTWKPPYHGPLSFRTCLAFTCRLDLTLAPRNTINNYRRASSFL